jgi:hypothetical protein
MGDSHILLADAGRPQRSDEYEWEYVRDTTLGDLLSDDIATALANSTFRPLQAGHAYSPKELRALRVILRMEGNLDTDLERLRSESDKFAILVGWQVRGERQCSARERAADVRKRLLAPAKDLLDTINDDDFSKEFAQGWGGLTAIDHAKLQEALQGVIAAAEVHITAIEEHKGRGKSWHYDLKRLHVHLTACFCEYFDNKFEPSRLSGSGKEKPRAFQQAVELLARPIFPSEGKGSGFLGAIREHIDNWNKTKKKLEDEIADSVAK